LARADGVVVPGGFGYRGIEGKILAARWARENKVPYPGPVPGHAGHVHRVCPPRAGQRRAQQHRVRHPSTKYPVIDLMPDQRDIADMGGTMRLGAYPCQLTAGHDSGRRLHEPGLRRRDPERHRHRFEFNNQYRRDGAHGLVFSGLSPDGRLVEIAELRDHPFMMGSQFHPEFKSRPHSSPSPVQRLHPGGH
jgi:CTP synthase